MDIFQILNSIDSILSILLLFLSIIVGTYIFFIDPLRRWRFFGYIPTAIILLIDYDNKEVLVLKRRLFELMNDSFTTFLQGGIYSGNIIQTINDTVNKEIGISPSSYNIRYVRELGTISIPQKSIRIKKFQYGTIGLSSLIRGKGYIGCICICNKHDVLKKIKLGYGIQSVKFIKFDKSFTQIESEKFQSGKLVIYNRAIKLMNEYFKSHEVNKKY